VAAATQSGVVVMNTPAGNSVTTAEHTIAMLMALARHIPQASAATRSGKWEKTRFMGTELHGKTLGIIGCGNIGALVATRAQALGMKVLAHDPFLTNDRARDLNVAKVELADLLPHADFITLHTPLTDKTRYLLNTETLAQTRRGVYILNCARGGLVEEAALLAALQSGQVAGAALDVFEEEPAPAANPLFALDTVIVTPHLGASTFEAQDAVAVEVAEQIADFLQHGIIRNAVNTAPISEQEAPRLRPYLQLAGQLGALAGQLVATSINAIHLDYLGQAADLKTPAITAHVLATLLGSRFEGINQINASHLANSHGISVRETISQTCDNYTSLIRLRLECEDGLRLFAGTLMDGRHPRIVNIDGILVEATLGPHMLFLRNHDKPGLIGAVGTLLGQHAINIATFHLGRHASSHQAIGLLETDTPASDLVLHHLQALPHIVEAKGLRFASQSG
jgi:D-3-phosphoglycerate dehydrogenase